MAPRKKAKDTEVAVTDEAALEHANTGGDADQPQPEPDVFDAQIARAAEQAAEHNGQELHTVEQMTADEIVREVADNTRMPESTGNYVRYSDEDVLHVRPVADQSPEQANGQHHEGNGEHKNGEQPRKPNYRETHVVPGGSVKVVDDGNRRGLGVKFELPEGEKPSPYVLEPIKEMRESGKGMQWRPDMDKQWRKGVSYADPVADRDDVRSRAADAASRIREERSQREAGGAER